MPLHGTSQLASETLGQRLRRLTAFVSRSFRLEMSKAIEYRGSLFGWAILGGAPLLASYVILKAIYSSDRVDTIGGYEFSTFVTYQMLAHLAFQVMTGWSVVQTVTQEIRNGEMNRYLIRPVPYGLFRAVAFCGYNTVFLALLLVPTVAVILLLGSDFEFHGVGNTLLAILLAMLGFWLQYLMVYGFALLAFWLDEVGGIFFVFVGTSKFLSGEMFPINLMPDWVLSILNWLPFPYIVYYPLQVYLGRGDPSTILSGLLVTTAWLCILILLVRWMWRRGVAHYCAFGG